MRRLIVVGLLLGLLAACGDDDTTDKEDLAAPATKYVALGDSYSAAPGVLSPTGPEACSRSDRNYPSLVAEELRPDTFVDVTCSGADTADMGRPQFVDVPPQLDAVTADTDIVTLGIGGNDFSLFAKLVGQCAFVRGQDPTGAPCRAAMNTTGKDKLLTIIAATRRRVADVVRRVRQHAPDATVLLVGYPQILPAEGTCPGRLPLADGDVAYARRINKALTDMLEDVARGTRATYVDLWRATAGHDVCADEPWINGRYEKPGSAAAFHPFAAEQEAAAERVLDALED
ncbi:SGNH/GDSL hydrolase family protein [Nocardioides sp. JQ2195]|uniref:SGNH/GDSL hydrolase family protein n=1 Tax=Nocardioides sp. JQ2195 TaxID=2592334 RepID=UPI00143E3175|nr:SGNH/GDSL hydrolase family protein [Nocardioides sp. JQ2195]QIX26097.1 SGNH/GDSL hydrolase family protein [Nocardioides sp. JQ2195]